MAERQEVSGGAVAPAPMCANSCGFFMNAATKNFCSKCYKEHLTKADDAVVAIDEKKIEAAKTAACVPDQLGGEDLDATAAAATATPPAARAPTTGKGNANANANTNTNDNPFKMLMLQLAEASDRRGGLIECANACGYFGCAATNNQCTLCYREFLQKAHSYPPAGSDNKVTKQPAAPKRCASCRKKVGLLGFPCRCGSTFCSMHRYAERHACGFDFKTAGREKIAKNNPLIVAAKISKI